ncbi:MAG: BPSS1187 family protein [Bacteroidota bacterium]
MRYISTTGSIIILCFFFIGGCSESTDPASRSTDLNTDTTQQTNPDPGAFKEYTVLPHEADVAIKASNEPHFAFVDTRTSLKGKLLVFLGGTDSYPRYYMQFPKTAASLGYHVVNINYLNQVSVRLCDGEADINCFARYHQEVIFGEEQSEVVKVDPANAIVNRVLTLLKYLHAKYPNEKWDLFFDANGLIYSKLLVAGHSQGGGHSAFLAHKVSVDRAIFFCSPNDYSIRYHSVAPWLSAPFATTADRLYGLIHAGDEIVEPSEQYATWKAMKMLMTADTASADKPTFRNFRALYTNISPNPAAPSSRLKHNAPVMDIAIPPGAPADHLKQVWIHLLGG